MSLADVGIDMVAQLLDISVAIRSLSEYRKYMTAAKRLTL
jgi:hypothetical protein